MGRAEVINATRNILSGDRNRDRDFGTSPDQVNGPTVENSRRFLVASYCLR
jgi:hypothetical protein